MRVEGKGKEGEAKEKTNKLNSGRCHKFLFRCCKLWQKWLLEKFKLRVFNNAGIYSYNHTLL